MFIPWSPAEGGGGVIHPGWCRIEVPSRVLVSLFVTIHLTTFLIIKNVMNRIYLHQFNDLIHHICSSWMAWWIAFHIYIYISFPLLHTRRISPFPYPALWDCCTKRFLRCSQSSQSESSASAKLCGLGRGAGQTSGRVGCVNDTYMQYSMQS